MYISEPTICCDIRNPTLLSSMDISEPSGHPSSQQPSPAPLTLEESDLYEALEDWREDKTAKVYGYANLNDFGPCLIMPTVILDCIVEAAHHRKIQSVQDLKKETGWTDSEVYGDEVVAIVQGHAAPLPSPFITAPLSLPQLNVGQPLDTI